MAKLKKVRLTATVGIDGQLRKKDTVVEVTEDEADYLISRGKAVLPAEKAKA